jgi:acetyl-CoA carboxylase biotin carboxylase subunit
MFKKVLIANRGEIALRVLWACKELGLKTVAVYSEADQGSLHVRFADQAVCIGPARNIESYLNIPAIISAAEITGADAIHPGYGFLSESSYLAEISEACNIKFIGPGPQAIRLMGDKSRARKAMMKAGVPVLPGSVGVLEDEETAVKVARDVGFPVVLKASAGGGGRGIRIVRSPADLAQAFRAAQAEAAAAFGVPDVYVEKYIEGPRHVEIQVMADTKSNVVHMGERECSIQRRHQKILEEAPSTFVSEKLRRKMGRTAVEAAAAVQYVSAGTVEFLVDDEGDYYFMEMNTRIQVEHGITELITGRDIVKEQIHVAAGAPLSFTQKDVTFSGHAIECRINAEDPFTFVPSPGIIRHFHVPGGPGVRIDTFAHEGCEISPYYDSLVAKLMTHGRDRKEAIARMRRCLELMVVEGIKTNIPLHRRILDDPDFQAGRVDTRFMERYRLAKNVVPAAS